MRKISFKYTLPALGVAGLTAIIGATIPALQSNGTEFSAANAAPKLKTQAAEPIPSTLDANQALGPIRQWGNTNFSGVELQDGGYAVLTDDAAASRIDAYGNLL